MMTTIVVVEWFGAPFNWQFDTSYIPFVEGNPKIGEFAPDFLLWDAQNEIQVSLAALRGKPVVLVFGSCT